MYAESSSKGCNGHGKLCVRQPDSGARRSYLRVYPAPQWQVHLRGRGSRDAEQVFDPGLHLPDRGRGKAGRNVR